MVRVVEVVTEEVVGWLRAAPPLAAFAVEREDGLRPRLLRHLELAAEREQRVEGGDVVVVDRDAADVAVEEVGRVRALGGAVVDHEAVGVPAEGRERARRLRRVGGWWPACS